MIPPSPTQIRQALRKAKYPGEAAQTLGYKNLATFKKIAIQSGMGEEYSETLARSSARTAALARAARSMKGVDRTLKKAAKAAKNEEESDSGQEIDINEDGSITSVPRGGSARARRLQESIDTVTGAKQRPITRSDSNGRPVPIVNRARDAVAARPGIETIEEDLAKLLPSTGPSTKAEILNRLLTLTDILINEYRSQPT